jgi:hypothetical protein
VEIAIADYSGCAVAANLLLQLKIFPAVILTGAPGFGAEWKDPHDLSFTTPIRGILTMTRAIWRFPTISLKRSQLGSLGADFHTKAGTEASHGFRGQDVEKRRLLRSEVVHRHGAFE